VRARTPAQLSPWTSDPSGAVVLLDFDGTLAPIVAEPAAARPLPGAVDALSELARRYLLVGVISGRPGRFLAEHLRAPGVERWGSYGVEQVRSDGTVETAPEAERWRGVVSEVVGRARRAAPSGVGVEDKGLSVTLHVRRAPEAGAWVRVFAEREAGTTGLAVHEARMSVELRPPLGIDKGSVVAGIVGREGVRSAMFVGDDRGDQEAFRALDGLATSLRVAVGSPELPPELAAAADLVVDGPPGVLDLLHALLGGPGTEPGG
jgi:trehalose 6-phosphate phosphatase